VAALAAVNTTISAAAGTLSTLLILYILNYRAEGQGVWDLLGAANGTLAGLVAITAGCAVVQVRPPLASLCRNLCMPCCCFPCHACIPKPR
jgi:ammonia channel protein AmtB